MQKLCSLKRHYCCEPFEVIEKFSPREETLLFITAPRPSIRGSLHLMFYVYRILFQILFLFMLS